MGQNDRHVAFDGGIRDNLEPDVPELLDHRDFLDAKINDQLWSMKMLKGTGCIVIDPADPRVPNEEYATPDEATAAAGHTAYTSRVGYAIVYVPLTVIRPAREVFTAPSSMLQELARKEAAKIVAAPKADTE